MKENFSIKKELTESDFQKILARFYHSLYAINESGVFIRYLQIIVKEITPAKEVQLIFPDKIQAITIENNSILSDCYRNQKAFYTNDIDREKNYNAAVDNFISEKMQKILYVPLVSFGRVTAIIMAGIPYKDWNQFTQRDIDYIERLEIPQKWLETI